MLLSDILCFVFLTVMITATCAAAENTKQELVDKKISRRPKREAIILDTFSPNTFKLDGSSRVSKLRYWQKKPKRGGQKPMYGPPSSPTSRIPVKRYRRKHIRPKYNKYSNKPNPKSKYPSSQYGRPSTHPKKHTRPQPYFAQEPAGFGEPPKISEQEYVQPPKQSYGEPPVDSYGNPLIQSYLTALSQNEKPKANLDYEQQYQSLQSYHQDVNIDNNNAYSDHHQIYTKPDPEEGYGREEPNKFNEVKFESYADVYKQLPLYDYQHIKQRGKNNAHNIHKNTPWKGKFKENEYQEHDHVVVGGQYAEPPGRLVPSYQNSALRYQSAEIGDSYVEPEIGSTGSISPYVNYKYSNMAFSPQNLNDAFSPFNN